MAHSETLQEAVLVAVAEQIGELLPVSVDLTRFDSEAFELGDSFELWTLDPDYDIKPAESLNQLVNRTDRWHHQIDYSKDNYRKSIAFAVSMPKDSIPYGRMVGELFYSEIAEKIDAAIDWIENNPSLQGDSLTRLLILQNYSVYAFWLVDLKQVYTIGCPKGFIYLRPNQLLSEERFLTTLRKEKPIAGRYKGEHEYR